MKQEIFEQLKRELCACRLCEGKFDHEPRAIFQGAQDANIMQISQAPSIHVHNSGLPFHDASGKKLRRNGIKSMMRSFMMSITSISLPWDTAIRERGNREIKSLPESVPEPGLCVSLTRWIISCISSSGQWPQRSCFPNEALRSSYFTISSCVESRLWCCRIHLHSMYAG